MGEEEELKGWCYNFRPAENSLQFRDGAAVQVVLKEELPPDQWDLLDQLRLELGGCGVVKAEPRSRFEPRHCLR